jgi:hypothetical protein
MLATVDVRGAGAHPLFQALAREAGPPRWNFNKYLLDAGGTVVARFDSGVSPTSEQMITAVEGVLNEVAGKVPPARRGRGAGIDDPSMRLLGAGANR